MNYANENERKVFGSIMKVTWQTYGRNCPDKETMKWWFDKLSDHTIEHVGNTFDKWLMTNDKELPTFKNIADLCKPNPTIFARLPSPLAIADNHRHAVEVKAAVDKMTSNLKDHRGWARDLISGKKVSNAPDLAIKYAKEALGASA